MRASKNRKLKGHAVSTLNVTVRREMYDHLNKWRGSLSLGAVVEELIVREANRRDKRRIKTLLPDNGSDNDFDVVND